MASHRPAGPVTADDIELLFAPLRDATGIVAAVSGGPDSVALMHFLAAWHRRGERPPVTIATVDHGLRTGSAGEARKVAAWARGLGFRHRVLTWEGEKPRTAIQEAAREERYRLLEELARKVKASHVVTGHTLDDQAETVLMRLLRGTGVGGLGGMRPEFVRGGLTLARPLLGVTKARLVASCEAAGWPYLDDPSNADPRFTRVRLRTELMPLLMREGLTVDRLATLAERARRDADALDAQAVGVLAAARIGSDAAATGRPGLELDGLRLAEEPDAILLRVVARAIMAAVGPLSRPTRLERFEAHVLGDLRRALRRGEALRITFGGALLTLSARGRLTLRPEPPRRRAQGEGLR